LLYDQDERLTGGYENVPTRDIHMNQVGLDPLWLEFLHLYVRPLQEHVFTGYFHDVSFYQSPPFQVKILQQLLHYLF
jgi:procollagen-lysine,2-oxoglutarate 5-dioxygenase